MTLEGIVAAVTAAWVGDPKSDVVWAGDHEGRRGVRMRQTVRDFTTVWFEVGDRTLGIEAGMIPEPRFHHLEVYRQCLVRNTSTRRLHFAVDGEGEVLLVGRIPAEEVTPHELELVLGEAWNLVEVAFPPLARLAFSREKET